MSAKDLDLAGYISDEHPLVSLREARDRVEKELIQKALLKHGGVVVRAAEELSVTRQTLADLIRKYGISIK